MIEARASLRRAFYNKGGAYINLLGEIWMKKQAIAAAIAAAFVSVPAVAQVTVSGNVEAGWASRDYLAGATKTKNEGITSQVVGTPVIRFSGTEDLGGGLKASFQLDFEHDTALGAVDNAVADLGVSTVGLAGNFGSITMGKSAFRSRDGGGLYRFFGNIGRLTAGGARGYVAGAGGTAIAATTTFNSADELGGFVEYVSPTVQGFSVSLGRANPGLTANGSTQARVQSVTLRGSFGPATFQYGQEQSKAANDGDSTNLNTLAGNANIGPARVGVVWAESRSVTNIATRALGGQVALPLAKSTTGGVGYINYTGDNSAATSVMALMAKYDLSKRTALFASYQSVTAETRTANIGASRGLNVGEIAGQTNTGYSLSVVHSF